MCQAKIVDNTYEEKKTFRLKRLVKCRTQPYMNECHSFIDLNMLGRFFEIILFLRNKTILFHANSSDYGKLHYKHQFTTSCEYKFWIRLDSSIDTIK